MVVGSVALASLHLRGVAAALGPSVAGLLTELPRVERDKRLDRVAARIESAAPETFERRLVEGLQSANNDRARAEAANEALGDLAAVLESRAKWSSAALRIVLLGGLLSAAVCLIRQEFVHAGIVAGLIAVGSGLTAWLGSKAGGLDKAHRKSADRLVELLVPDAPRETANRGRFRDAW